MSTILKLALTRIRFHRSQTILTGIAFVLTTCLLMAVGSLSFGLVSSQKQLILESINNCHAFFYEVTPSQLETLKLHQDFASGNASELYAEIVHDKMNATLRNNMVLLPGVRSHELAEGRFPEEINEIAGPPSFFERLGYSPEIGSEVNIPYRVLGEGEVIQNTFIITGLLEQVDISKLNVADSRIAYAANISEALADTLSGEKRVFTVSLKVHEEDPLSRAEIEQIIYEMAEDVGVSEDNVVLNVNYLMWVYDPNIEFIVGTVGIAGLIVVFAILVIYSIYYVSTIANVHELGKLKALGATKKQMKYLLLVEGLMTAILSLPVGIVLGYLAAKVGMNVVYSTYFSGAPEKPISLLSLPILLSVIAVVLVTAILSLLIPMRQVSKISPIEAIRFQEKNIGRQARRKGFQYLNISRLSSANLRRNRRRTNVTIVSLGLGGILFLFVAGIGSSMDYFDFIRAMSLAKGEFRINLKYETNDLTYTENNLDSLQMEDVLGQELVREIETISGVTKVSSQNALLAYVDPIGYDSEKRHSIFAFSEDDVNGFLLQKGEINYQQMIENNGIVFSWDYGMEQAGYEIGDTIRLTLFDGKNQVPFEGTITASILDGDGLFMIPEEVMNQYVTNTNPAEGLYIWVEGGMDGEYYPEVKSALREIVDNDPLLTMISIDEEYSIAKMSIDPLKSAAYMICGILGVVGFMNLINTMIISVVSRQKELAILKALGLSHRQTVMMLWKEGLTFTGGMLILALTVGNYLGYLGYQWCAKQELVGIQNYHYPLIETLIMLGALLFVQLFLTTFLSRYIQKKSLTESLR